MKNTLSLIAKLLLLLTLSSAMFSKGFDLDIGGTSPGLQVSAKHYIGKSFYVEMESGFSLISDFSTIGVGMNKGKFDISTYYRTGKGTLGADKEEYSGSETKLKFLLSQWAGFKLNLHGTYRYEDYKNKSYHYGFAGIGIYRKIGKSFYIDASYQPGITTDSGSDILVSFSIGYSHRY